VPASTADLFISYRPRARRNHAPITDDPDRRLTHGEQSALAAGIMALIGNHNMRAQSMPISPRRHAGARASHGGGGIAVCSHQMNGLPPVTAIVVPDT
jgi:hypothetical protein